ncbi:Peptidase M10 serralysin C terminal [Nitrosomonas aestuarii]|uniref:Peptidase M10 serralysin C terminal n=1 Tax=Nitrosomonas aestuarii TaxID=52441 RepID=A0A1I4EIF1_9PROT|nr:M10 family metallopeptidase [Nitrosomonas aestuarii]SFL04830.1 Peptidase M10 serralysin C terminal [Nitrosomonas aestuarii]
MPTPFSFSEISLASLTDSNSVNSLILGFRWKNPVISFSFPDNDARWSADPFTGYGPGEEPWSASYTPLSFSNQSDFLIALQQWENVANIDFNFIDESDNSVGDIRIAYTEVRELDNAEAWAYLPANGVWSGDIWINKSGNSAVNEWTRGDFSFLTVLHEIGHALGLQHPFEGSSFSIAEDTMSATIMSYSALPGNQNSIFDFYPTTPMPLDIKAIQHLYGANQAFHIGNDIYHYTDDSTYHQTIWDSAGTDSISYTGTQAAFIQLEESQGSYIGHSIHATSRLDSAIVPNIWIAYDTVIENASGGQNNDVLFGNQYDNSLSGNDGNDTFMGLEGNDIIMGGAGIDEALFDGKLSDYTIKKNDEEFSIQHLTGNNGLDKLISIERLSFDDMGLALDLDGSSGQIAKLLGVVFGASSVNDKHFVKIGLSLIDNGISSEQLTSAALDAAGVHSHDSTVTLLWRNLFGSDPTTEEKQPYVNLLNSNNFSAVELTLFAANTSFNADNIDLIGLMQNGIEFSL